MDITGAATIEDVRSGNARPGHRAGRPARVCGPRCRSGCPSEGTRTWLPRDLAGALPAAPRGVDINTKAPQIPGSPSMAPRQGTKGGGKKASSGTTGGRCRLPLRSRGGPAAAAAASGAAVIIGYIGEARAALAAAAPRDGDGGDDSAAAAALGLVAAVLEVSPRMEAALELRARALLALRRYRMLRKHQNDIVFGGATLSFPRTVQRIREEGRPWAKTGLIKGDVKGFEAADTTWADEECFT
ncbi:hypothetical protein VPH35_034778 [Triticum aestivum]